MCFVFQIYIGGDNDGAKMLADQPTAPLDPNWTLTPGAVIEEVCGAPFEALHFTGKCKQQQQTVVFNLTLRNISR